MRHAGVAQEAEAAVPVEGERGVRQGRDAALRGGDAHEALQEEDPRHHRHRRRRQVGTSRKILYAAKKGLSINDVLKKGFSPLRRTLKNRILQYDPDQFGTPLPHTSRAKRPEEDNGMRYWFVDREDMEFAIKVNH